MGVTLERVQNKFACIIGELCSEPDILSEFAIWLDLRLAEYKAKGAISLECSGESPDPTWLRGYKGPPKRMKRGETTPRSHSDHLHLFDSEPRYEQDLSQEAAERLSPEIMVVKEELSDGSGVYPVSVHRHPTPSRNHGRKRSEPGSSGQSGSPSPFKMQRLSEPATVLEPVNQSLMSIISESGLDDSGDTTEMSSTDLSNIDLSTNRGDNSAVFPTQVIPSTSGGDLAEHQDGSNSGDVWSSSPRHNLAGFGQEWTYLQGPGFPESLNTKAIRKRIVDPDFKPAQTVGHMVSSVATFERWLWQKTGVHQKIDEISPAVLDGHLAEFYPSLKKGNGEDYDPQHLSKLRSYMERFLREAKYQYSISKSHVFTQSKLAFLRRRKELLDKLSLNMNNNQ